MVMDAVSLRRWISGRRAAEQRELDERRMEHRSVGESFEQAMRLVALASRLHGWPLPDDPVSARQDAIGYQRWDRLRAAWQRHAGTERR